jgi:hypothetical protein
MLNGFHGVAIFAVVMGGLFIGALILQAACALYNKLAGVGALGDDGLDAEQADRLGCVPNLSLGQALGIVFIAAALNAIVGFVVGRFMGGPRVKAGGIPWTFSPVAYLVTLPFGMLLMSALVPTRFGKGLLVTLLYTCIWLVLGIVLVALVFVISLAFGLHLMG